jgi:hypothetical protein
MALAPQGAPAYSLRSPPPPPPPGGGRGTRAPRRKWPPALFDIVYSV